jgi:adenylate cyclase
MRPPTERFWSDPTKFAKLAAAQMQEPLPLKRKLTTILVADAQGYSAMMQSDEAATLDRLHRYRSIMKQLFERHEGRQVNTWGDTVIAEFPSVVEAVRCAVEIQDSLTTENHSLPAPRQMWFRIGINLGDVMIDGEDLYGDGVNVAARLQSLAEPGGIMVSGAVYSLAHKQLALAFDFVGDQEVKNIDEPVPSYRVRMAGRNQPASSAAEDRSKPVLDDSDSVFTRRASQLEGGWAWLQAQPRRIRIFAALIALFFVLNLLFDGLARPWFLFPSAPFAILILLHLRRQRRPRRISS